LLRNSPHFMEPRSSLPHSQAPATCPYPEADLSTPSSPSHFLKIYLNNILPFKPSTSKRFLSLRFPHQNPISLLPLPHTCHLPRPVEMTYTDPIYKIMMMETDSVLGTSVYLKLLTGCYFEKL